MMNDSIDCRPTMDELQRRWARCLMASEKAVDQRYKDYCNLKRLVKKINTGLVDVADYYLTAVSLGAMLSDISSNHGPTVFYYYAEQIDPRKRGDVRCFRMECRQLSKQLDEIDRRRRGRGPLRVIK